MWSSNLRSLVLLLLLLLLLLCGVLGRVGAFAVNRHLDCRQAALVSMRYMLPSAGIFNIDGVRLWQQTSPSTDDGARVTSATAPSQDVDPAFPYKFKGRCIFVPSLVRLPEDNNLPSGISVLNLAGWTVGGTVVLEYDESAVGYYREWVDLGGLALYTRQSPQGQSFLVGQYGSNLFVSRPEAEELCVNVWGLVAKRADIEFSEQTRSGVCELQRNETAPTGSNPILSTFGWKELWKHGRLSFSGLNLLWTPTIKAIWTCLGRLPSSSVDTQQPLLPLHRLRLAGRVGLSRFNTLDEADADSHKFSWPKQRISLGVGLTVEGLVIEITPEIPGLE